MARVRFRKVREHAERIAVVGTGASLRGFDLDFARCIKVIAVNAAIRFLPRTDAWFTLDPSESNRAILRRRRQGVTYYAAVPEDYGCHTALDPNMRAPPENGVIYLHRVEGDLWGRYRARAGVSGSKGSVHTGNSAWGAYQLALHMEPKRVALFGVDGFGPYRDGSGSPRNLDMMPELFTSGVTDVPVVNGSPDSVVTCFPRMSPEEARAWLEGP